VAIAGEIDEEEPREPAACPVEGKASSAERGAAGAGTEAGTDVIAIVRRSSAPLVLRAMTVTEPPTGGILGAVYKPSGAIEPALALHLTPGPSLATIAESWTLVPAMMLDCAPAIARLG
jgi:hypothetical protein